MSRARWSARPWVGGPLRRVSGYQGSIRRGFLGCDVRKATCSKRWPGAQPEARLDGSCGQGPPWGSLTPDRLPGLGEAPTSLLPHRSHLHCPQRTSSAPSGASSGEGNGPLPRLRGDPLAQRSPPGPHPRPCAWGLPGPRGRLSYLLFLIFFNLIFQPTYQSRAWRHVIKLLVSFK